MERAFDTASIICSNNIHTSKTDNKENHATVQGNKLLREMSFGIFDLKTIEEYKLAAKEAGYKEGKNLWDFNPEGGEDQLAVRKRVEEFLRFLTKTIVQNEQPVEDNKTKNYCILLVSHAGWIRQLLAYLDQYYESDQTKSCNNIRLTDYIPLKLQNTAISNFDLSFDTGTGDLISVSCTKYGCAQHLDKME